MDHISVDAIGLAGLELRPEKTSHDSQDPECITFVAHVTSKDVVALESFIGVRKYGAEERFFPVRITGDFHLSGSMRFGQVLWQEVGAGRTYLITLVAPETSTSPRNGISAMFDRTDRIVDELVATRVRLDALIEALAASGSLPAESSQQLAGSSQKDEIAVRRRLDRVDDVETYWM